MVKITAINHVIENFSSVIYELTFLSFENSDGNVPLNRLPNKFNFSRLYKLNRSDGKFSMRFRDRFNVVIFDVLPFQIT